MVNYQYHTLEDRSMTWEQFVKDTPPGSIALDGTVYDAPRIDWETGHFNFDHHKGVVRKLTPSTTKQVFLFAEAGDLAKVRETYKEIHIYMHPIDRDSGGASFLIEHYPFQIQRTHRRALRMVNFIDVMDVSCGSYPVDLSDRLVQDAEGIFAPYELAKKTGELYNPHNSQWHDSLRYSVHERFLAWLNDPKGIEPMPVDTRHVIKHKSSKGFWLVEETGGSGARVALYQRGMEAFFSIVARLPNGNRVVSVGKRCDINHIDLLKWYDILNKAEGLNDGKKWGGSDLGGGSARGIGTHLTDRDLIECGENACSSS